MRKPRITGKLTPHNDAKINEISPVVLFVGDPKRATYIAKTFLTKAQLVSEVRGMVVYTGFYKKERITIASHGMGIPSIGIYSYELYNVFKTKIIIRMGTCGSYSHKLPIGSVFVAQNAFSESSFAEFSGVPCPKHIVQADKGLVKDLMQLKKNKKCIAGLVHTTDVFYSPDSIARLQKLNHGALAVEMETYGLYINAVRCKTKALAFFTVTDSIIDKKSLSSAERVTGVNDMLKMGLELAYKQILKLNHK
jgi:purine-nucleoside phosphorylase